jgi:uncharacterized membrane protein
MSNLIVITFNDTHQAGEAFQSLKNVQSQGDFKLDDAAVVVKEESGKVEVKNTLDTGVKFGALGGGVLGLLLASVFFPLAGVALGALIGGLLGKAAHLGVDKDFVREVTDSLKPGMSALFVMLAGDPSMAIAALRQYQGTVYQTTLPEETLEALQDALKKSA